MRGLPKVPGGKVYLGERVLRLLDISQVEARERGEPSVSPVHLLLGIPLETRSPAAGGPARVGRDLATPGGRGGRASARRPRRGPRRVPGRQPGPSARGHGPATAPAAPITNNTRGLPWDRCSPSTRATLTALAATGKMDPVIGRDEEIRG
jgi:ATP-dependent Clp protease ATP-binding subunit ClpA